ncbi:DNA gyrase subunit A [Buchnera aphidicola (Cinara kochiana kochiana)]|uniref:DNA gyrase subunit A n=1 Tax=Buchnera aphidicola (Cinara kochiana kochiana) TaxID=2518976 RepID=A0A451D5B6_9GAMM|nr:DNA topoisomerase (ATP-hydrolyzing) subunit A [Buchnera aphidicola]VFP81041.1 DNA gyrase subunit A [Buchnera aphidicola (Cinara kochiana kochiana)]
MKDIAQEIKQVNIEDELKRSYLDYAMSVIIGRALPDVRDGLKPVHRRILFAMNVLNNEWNKPYKKSARIVGDVIGKYHPHGDSAVYDAIVRMAQPFSLRYTLIDGQGNFGSIDGDSAAAMRYTEIRMSKITNEMLSDLDKNTVNFILNYDGTEKIPEILPAKIPNLLINGSSGIAVGMATNIPPHNLKEIINGCIAYLNNPSITLKKLMIHIPGPDFPTAGIIYGKNGIEDAYRTGKGKISVRSKYSIEINNKNKKESLIIYELPYQVNKSKLIEKIALLIKEKKIIGISTIRDESDKDGMRIVIEIKKDYITKVVLNQLYTMTSLQTSFGINMVALSSGQPKQMSLKSILKEFIEHRKQIITRKYLFKIKKYTKKIHILEGFYVALNNINKIIEVIKIANNNQHAKKNLKKMIWKNKLTINHKDGIHHDLLNFNFSKKQVNAILNIKLNKLTKLEKNNIFDEYKYLIKKKIKLRQILSDSYKLKKIINNELLKIKKQFSDIRRTKIISKTSEINMEDIIVQESVVVTLSHSGYVKYQPISDYNAQKRGGKGKSAAKTKEEDHIENLLVANSHDTILCFSSRGILYWMKVYQLPETSRHARGRPIVNLLPLTQQERITTILPISEYKPSINIVMATALGFIKKTPLNQFQKPRNTGIIAINLRKNDELIGAKLTNGNNNILMFTSKGKVVQFSENEIRNMGRTASGIKGIKILNDDKLVSLLIPNKKDDILIVTENGYGKRTKINQFPIKSRATKGVISIRVTPKNGVVIGAIQVRHNNQIMIITNAGTLVRTRVSEITILKRNTQGVILIRTTKNEKVVGLQKLSHTPLLS